MNKKEEERKLLDLVRKKNQRMFEISNEFDDRVYQKSEDIR